MACADAMAEIPSFSGLIQLSGNREKTARELSASISFPRMKQIDRHKLGRKGTKILRVVE
jgi:hypothetical protein